MTGSNIPSLEHQTEERKEDGNGCMANQKHRHRRPVVSLDAGGDPGGESSALVGSAVRTEEGTHHRGTETRTREEILSADCKEEKNGGEENGEESGEENGTGTFREENGGRKRGRKRDWYV